MPREREYSEPLEGLMSQTESLDVVVVLQGSSLKMLVDSFEQACASIYRSDRWEVACGQFVLVCTA